MIQFFNTNARNYVAYTDQVGSDGFIRFRTLTKTGALNSTPYTDFRCPGFPTSSILWMGIEPSGGNANISINNTYASKGATLNSAFPASTDPAYTSVTKTCFRSGLNLAANTTVSATNASVADDAAKALTTATLTMGPRVSASYVSGSIRYLIDGIHASFSPWGSNPYSSNNARIFASTPAPLTGSYANNEVIKTIVAGNRLIQIIGPNETKSTLYGSHLMVSTVTENGSGGLSGSPTAYDLVSLCGSNPADHPSTAYPVDAVYIPSGSGAGSDTLFVLMTDLDGAAPKGRLFEISNATGVSASPSCRLASASLMVPNRSRDVYNPLYRRMVVDTHNGLVWGIITSQNGQPGMIYSYDYISRRSPKSQILSFSPHSIVYFSGASGGVNSIQVLNATDKSLYRIW